MSDDYIPPPDPEFQDWFNQFSTWCNANGATRGLTAGEVTALSDSYSDWNAEWVAYGSAHTAAQAATMSKDTARGASEPLIRAAVAKLQASSATSDADRTAAGITVRSTSRTPAAVPTTRPLAMVDASKRLEHTIHFKDEMTPNSKAKPPGVLGAEIWCFVGATPPADISTCHFVALDTKTPYVVHYEGGDANKVAHYILLWVSTRGAKGPMSETVSATIGA